jgi:hypothetical protein
MLTREPALAGRREWIGLTLLAAGGADGPGGGAPAGGAAAGVAAAGLRAE